MAATTTKFFILSLTAAVALAVIAEEGPDSPRQYNNHPVPFKPMDLNEIFDSDSTTLAASVESETEFTTAEPEKNLNEKSKDEQDISSELEGSGDELARAKKAALTTICIRVKSENPNEKNYEYCEPLSKEEPTGYGGYPSRKPNYGYPPQHPQVRPIYQHGPYKSPAVRPAPPTGYGQLEHAPNRGGQPGRGNKNTPGYTAEDEPDVIYQKGKNRPFHIEYDIMPPQVMVIPHVPVAEPYHVPQTPNRQYGPHTGTYRTSPTEEEPTTVDGGLYQPTDGARTPYNPYENPRGKLIYDYHKTKNIDYLPIVTKTTKKTSPVDILKVLKDIKKKKIKLEYDDDDDNYEPAYGGYPSYGGGYSHHVPQQNGYEPGYGGHEHEPAYGGHEPAYGGHPPTYTHHIPGSYGEHHHQDDENTHGLVITCQPSAIGYNGPQPQLELAKHMELLKHLIHVESGKTYGEVPQIPYSLPQLKPGVQVSTGYGGQPQMIQGSQYGSQSSSAVHLGAESPSGGYVPPQAYRTPAGGKLPYSPPSDSDTRQPPYGRNAAQEESNWEGANANIWDQADAETEDVGSPRRVQTSANPAANSVGPSNVSPTVSMQQFPVHRNVDQYPKSRKSGHIDGQHNMNQNL